MWLVYLNGPDVFVFTCVIHSYYAPKLPLTRPYFHSCIEIAIAPTAVCGDLALPPELRWLRAGCVVFQKMETQQRSCKAQLYLHYLYLPIAYSLCLWQTLLISHLQAKLPNTRWSPARCLVLFFAKSLRITYPHEFCV